MVDLLVTGATGGLGRTLVEALVADGKPVRATGRNRRIGHELAGQGAQFIAADLVTDDLISLVRGIKTVFHLAALAAPWGPEANFINANEIATKRLLEASRAAGIETFIFTSTPSIYAKPKDQFDLTETSALPARLANAYARTKRAAEEAVLAAARSQFQTVVLRPRAIIGPYDTVLLPRLLHAAERGVMPLPRGGRALIEPTDARDVVMALRAAEQYAGQLNGRVFNISGGQPQSLVTLATHVFERLGRSVRLVSLPATLTLALGGLCEGLSHLSHRETEPALTRYSVMTLGWSQTFDLSAARKALHWEPLYHPLQSIDWALATKGLVLQCQDMELPDIALEGGRFA